MDDTRFDLLGGLAKGEAHLRRELAVLAPWHLIDVIAAHGLSPLHRTDLNRLSRDGLTEIIVAHLHNR